MARYRKVDVRIYADEKFRALSAPQPNAQTLWLRLLTGEHTGIVPGLSRVGEAALAEQLGWPLAAFRRCFAEIAAAGMVLADWGNRLVWLPNGIRYNEPDNQKVVTGWRSSWDEMPDCPLKASAWAALDSYMAERDQQRAAATGDDEKKPKGPPFQEAFRKACPKPSAKPYRDGSGNGTPNKEQEQEQEHDRTTPPLAQARAQDEGQSMDPQGESAPGPNPHPVETAEKPRDPADAPALPGPHAAAGDESPGPGDAPAESGAAQANAASEGGVPSQRPDGGEAPGAADRRDTASAGRGAPARRRDLRAEDYPETSRLLAELAAAGFEAAYPRDAVAAGAVERAVALVGIATARERVMAVVEADRALRVESRPWLGWYLDAIQGNAKPRGGGEGARAARAVADIRVGVGTPSAAEKFGEGGERELR